MYPVINKQLQKRKDGCLWSYKLTRASTCKIVFRRSYETLLLFMLNLKVKFPTNTSIFFHHSHHNPASTVTVECIQCQSFPRIFRKKCSHPQCAQSHATHQEIPPRLQQYEDECSPHFESKATLLTYLALNFKNQILSMNLASQLYWDSSVFCHI